MKAFTQYTGLAAPLLRDNIDTDQIIPSREMKTVSKTGLSDGLFAGQRYINNREINPDFILNNELYDGATILLAGQNFGCGSSREHAVWALIDYGFRAVIAESFGEIFYNNSVRNGLLPIELKKSDIEALDDIVSIDLNAQTVDAVTFNIAQSDKDMLLGGFDPIDMTLQHKAVIEAFFVNDKAARPWKYDDN